MILYGTRQTPPAGPSAPTLDEPPTLTRRDQTAESGTGTDPAGGLNPCPACQGSGEEISPRWAGSPLSPNAVTRSCGYCAGNGVVPAELSEQCFAGCGTWVDPDQGCALHRSVCAGCRPRCGDCEDDGQSDYVRTVRDSLRSLVDPDSGRIDNWSDR